MLGYWEWLDGLERGLAAHHAGHAAGVQGGRRGAVRPRAGQGGLRHRDAGAGHQHAGPLRGAGAAGQVQRRGARRPDAGEYTQLTGRAGRRGIDVEGHAVVVWSPEVDPRHVAGLASTRTYPLRSSFRPSYNMAVNLGRHGRRGGRPRAAGVVVRPVPGGPVGGRAGPAGAAQRGDDGGPRRCEMGCDARRLRGVLRDPRSASRDREKALARHSAAASAVGRAGVAGPAEDRRRDPGPVRSPGRRSRWCSTRAAAASASHVRWCSPRTGGPAGSPPAEFTAAGRGARPGCGCPSISTTGRRRSGAILAAALRQAVGRRRAGSRRPGRAAAGEDDELIVSAHAAAASTRATPARTGRSTPAGPSGGPGWRARHQRCGEGGQPDRVAGPDLRPGLRCSSESRGYLQRMAEVRPRHGRVPSRIWG